MYHCAASPRRGFFSEAPLNVIDALRTRRSIGKLDGIVEEHELNQLLEAAMLAPNHHVTEPWTFTVVRGDARERLGRRWADAVAAELPSDAPGRAARLESEARKFMRAPLLIIASVRTDADPVTAVEDFAATAAAVQNILLAAVELGLGAVWRTGGMAYSAIMNEAYGLEASDRIVGIVYVGRPAGEPKPRAPRRFAVRTLD